MNDPTPWSDAAILMTLCVSIAAVFVAKYWKGGGDDD